MVMVDDEDFELLSENRWQRNGETGAVQRCERVAGWIVTIFKGVYWNRDYNAWVATIRIPGSTRQTPLGKFSSELAARDAYDASARRYFEEFAYTNS